MRHLPSDTITGAADAAVEVVPGRIGAGLLILCDHASNALPADHGTLGLPAEELQRHIAYDIGAAATTRALAEALGAPAALSRFSRLLIDPNRGEEDPTLVMRLSDGAVVPGNARIDAGEIERRLARFWRPYHAAIEAAIDRSIDAGIVPALVSIHTFTPVWRGRARPWHAGILWDRDPRLARPLLAALAADAHLVVGDNEPYDGALRGDCMWRHGTVRGLPHAIVEIRQDLVAEAEGARAWAARLAGILQRLMDEPALRRIEHYGSRTDRPILAPKETDR